MKKDIPLLIPRYLLSIILFWFFAPVTNVWGIPTNRDKPYLIEGDIILDKPVLDLILSSNAKRRKRAVVKQTIKTWENRIVPYIMDTTLEKATVISVKKAIEEMQRYSCIKFKPRTKEKDFIDFTHGDGCFSHIGRQGGRQIISLGPGCGTKTKVLHELMHSIGFFHEQSRYDRDLYVKILWWNIVPGAEKNFAVYSHGNLDTMGIPYDTNSITHYDNKAFSKNGKNTVEAIDNPSKPLGESHLSKLDVKQINLLYKCTSKREVKCFDRTQLCERLHKVTRLCSVWPKMIIKRLCPLTCGLC